MHWHGNSARAGFHGYFVNTLGVGLNFFAKIRMRVESSPNINPGFYFVAIGVFFVCIIYVMSMFVLFYFSFPIWFLVSVLMMILFVVAVAGGVIFFVFNRMFLPLLYFTAEVACLSVFGKIAVSNYDFLRFLIMKPVYLLDIGVSGSPSRKEWVWMEGYGWDEELIFDRAGPDVGHMRHDGDCSLSVKKLDSHFFLEITEC